MVRRVLVVLLSVGWMAPFCFSFWAVHHFLTEIVWPRAAWGKLWGGSYHPALDGITFFYISMAWLAVVIIGWTWHLSSPASGAALAKKDN